MDCALLERTMGSHTDFRTHISEKANNLIINFLPACIRQLDELLRAESFKNENIENVQRCSELCIQEIATSNKEGNTEGRRYMKDYKSNSVIVDLVQTLKPIIFELLEAINTLRMWILLLIPEVADGNNFGVEVKILVMLAKITRINHSLSNSDPPTLISIFFTTYFRCRKVFLVGSEELKVKLTRFTFRRSVISYQEEK